MSNVDISRTHCKPGARIPAVCTVHTAERLTGSKFELISGSAACSEKLLTETVRRLCHFWVVHAKCGECLATIHPKSSPTKILWRLVPNLLLSAAPGTAPHIFKNLFFICPFKHGPNSRTCSPGFPSGQCFHNSMASLPSAGGTSSIALLSN